MFTSCYIDYGICKKERVCILQAHGVLVWKITTCKTLRGISEQVKTKSQPYYKDWENKSLACSSTRNLPIIEWKIRCIE